MEIFLGIGTVFVPNIRRADRSNQKHFGVGQLLVRCGVLVVFFGALVKQKACKIERLLDVIWRTNCFTIAKLWNLWMQRCLFESLEPISVVLGAPRHLKFFCTGHALDWMFIKDIIVSYC